MTTAFHTPLAEGARLNAAVLNVPHGQLDAELVSLNTDVAALDTRLDILEPIVAGLDGGAGISEATLKEWTEAGAYELLTATYHGTYTNVVASATVKWPDGQFGDFVTTTINTTHEAIDAYTVTHNLLPYMVTQAAVTRNADGNVTVKPALTVSIVV